MDSPHNHLLRFLTFLVQLRLIKYETRAMIAFHHRLDDFDQRATKYTKKFIRFSYKAT